MKIMKFGGTSIGKPQRMKEVAGLVASGNEPTIVVLSALSGTTNSLVEICELLASNDRDAARQKIKLLHENYLNFIDELLSDPLIIEKAIHVISEHFEFLFIILKISFSEALSKDILAQGELLSTKLFSLYLEERKMEHKSIIY